MAADPRQPSGIPSEYRSGFVGLIGKPNVGKSTILNAFVGHKISITSPRPQTTRHRILGILTRPTAQVIFIDSPGWHKPHHPLGRYLVTVAKGVIEEADVLLTVIDAVSGVGQEDEWVFEQARRTTRPTILAINKVDLVAKSSVLPTIARCAALNLFEELIPVSAVTGDNMESLLTQLIARLPPGPRWYEPEQLTDQSTDQVIREFIREQVLRATRQEVPHAVAVLLDAVTSKDQPPTAQGPSQRLGVMVIQATILVEREGQKAIIIGKKGERLKQIGTACRLELERWLGRRVFLDLWVKVAKEWRTNSAILRQLGYASTTHH